MSLHNISYQTLCYFKFTDYRLCLQTFLFTISELMKNLFILVSLTLINAAALANSPKYAATTKKLSENNEYIKNHKAYDYWKLSPYYVPQHNPKACGVATTTMLLNALRADQTLTAADELFTHTKILSLSKKLKSAVGTMGKGISLDDLKNEIEALVTNQLKATKYKVETYRFSEMSESEALQKLENLLKENEASADNFIVANFLQSELTGDPEGAVGHHAPIAAYDSKSKMVLIFDPDRTYYEPYWAPLSAFLKGLNSIDSGAKKSRGLIFVQKTN